LKLVASECMTSSPKTISENELGATALARMEAMKITSLVVVDSGQVILGVLHLHDLWRTQMF
jgi:arabinose-5-phosphate isomerase